MTVWLRPPDDQLGTPLPVDWLRQTDDWPRLTDNWLRPTVDWLRSPGECLRYG